MMKFKLLLALACMGLVSACAIVEGDKVDYAAVVKTQGLSVPPDLTQLNRDTRFVPPSASVSASAMGSTDKALLNMTDATAPNAMGNVRIERAGSKRWLVIDQPSDALWDNTKDFWKSIGLKLTLDDRKLGLMETDWAENRAKLPHDGFSNFMKKALGALMDTGLRDKYRTRFESVGDKKTEIFISHRSITEISLNNSAANNTNDIVWREGNPDPEMELEMLRRLMLQLGLKPAQAASVIAAADKAGVTDLTAATAAAKSKITDTKDGLTLTLDDGFDRAWRRLGLALDRTGFTVEDRDRAQGTYFVRYVDVLASKEEPGFWARLMGEKSIAPVKYRVALRADGSTSSVRLLTETGTAEDKIKAKPILDLLAKELQ
jgi:outer membrane protein assembly factor BamC